MKHLDSTLANVIDKSITLAEKTGQFVIEQAPDLIKQFYAWHIGKNIFYIIMFAILSVVLYKIGKSIIDAYKNKELGYHEEDLTGLGYVFYVCMGFPIFFTALKIYNIVYILLAPKLYIIEYFIKLRQ